MNNETEEEDIPYLDYPKKAYALLVNEFLWHIARLSENELRNLLIEVRNSDRKADVFFMRLFEGNESISGLIKESERRRKRKAKTRNGDYLHDVLAGQIAANAYDQIGDLSVQEHSWIYSPVIGASCVEKERQAYDNICQVLFHTGIYGWLEHGLELMDLNDLPALYAHHDEDVTFFFPLDAAYAYGLGPSMCVVRKSDGSPFCLADSGCGGLLPNEEYTNCHGPKAFALSSYEGSIFGDYDGIVSFTDQEGELYSTGGFTVFYSSGAPCQGSQYSLESIVASAAAAIDSDGNITDFGTIPRLVEEHPDDEITAIYYCKR